MPYNQQNKDTNIKEYPPARDKQTTAVLGTWSKNGGTIYSESRVCNRQVFHIGTIIIHTNAKVEYQKTMTVKNVIKFYSCGSFRYRIWVYSRMQFDNSMFFRIFLHYPFQVCNIRGRGIGWFNRISEMFIIGISNSKLENARTRRYTQQEI